MHFHYMSTYKVVRLEQISYDNIFMRCELRPDTEPNSDIGKE